MKIKLSTALTSFVALIAISISSCSKISKVPEPEFSASASAHKISCEPLCEATNEAGEPIACKMVSGTEIMAGHPVHFMECDCSGCSMLLSDGSIDTVITPNDFFFSGEDKLVSEMMEHIDRNETSTLGYVTEVSYLEIEDFNGTGLTSYGVIYDYVLSDGSTGSVGFKYVRVPGEDPEVMKITCEGSCDCKVRVCCALDFYCSCTPCDIKYEDIEVQ